MVDPQHPAVDPLKGACVFSDQTLPEELPSEPLAVLMEWMTLAATNKTQPNPNAMSLCTVDADGTPSVRVVLARSMDVKAGTVTFYTNYTSRKGRAIGATGRVAAGFFWDQLDRQASIEGIAMPVSAAESDAYFNSRHPMSRVAAWASDQSQPLARREDLLAKDAAMAARYAPGYHEGQRQEIVVPRPSHWGGFRIYVSAIELWLGHTHRLHDRARWTRELRTAMVDGVAGMEGASAWRGMRLQP
jgi:pyridoxamine 5'-phosphate oxidase